MPQDRIPNKHIKTLTRRMGYLEKLDHRGEANSYDLAEIAALRRVIDFIQVHQPEEEEELHYTDQVKASAGTHS